MLVKSADDKSKRLILLQELQQSPVLDARQKEWLRDELRRCKTGIEGEREAAFHLDGHYKDSPNHVLLHDLRFELEGEVAQIDHLVINRTLSRALEFNDQFFQQERDKLEGWAEDRIVSAEQALKDTKLKLKGLKRQARMALSMEGAQRLQQDIRNTEQRRQRQEILAV